MTNEEFQKLVLEELSKINTRLSSVETNMATKEDIVKLEQRFDQLDDKLEKDVHEVLKRTYDKIEIVDKKLDSIAATQNVQGESINILAMRQLQTESEFATFRKAK